MISQFQRFLNVWAIVGPFVGIFLGSWLTTKNQHRHWLLDNKRSETRDLLTTIADSGSKLLVFWGRDSVGASGEEKFMIRETARQSVDVIYNGLFIADEVKKLNVLKIRLICSEGAATSMPSVSQWIRHTTCGAQGSEVRPWSEPKEFERSCFLKVSGGYCAQGNPG